MCIKIISSKCEIEFDPKEPLENQVVGANKIVVSYDPIDPKIASFEGQIELMIKNGISCKADIEVKTNNYLNGIRLERRLENLKLKLDVNEVVKGLANFHAEADKKLCELSEICLGKLNER